mgnify:CR=1 FL=1|tara:strand:+ start:160 stop:681 length:522 start_codon:yes stop_codon:yes gene_type:complete
MLELYYRFSLREKALFMGFIWFVLLFWGFGTFGRVTQSIKGISTQAKLLGGQKKMIDREPQIDADLIVQQSKFDSSRTYDKDQLFARVEVMAERMDPTMSTSRTQEGEIFNIHTVPVRFRDEPIASLIQFDTALQGEPYISLESARINADRKDPMKLDAVFEITSFELKQQSP